uniref:Transmembrane protein n=1 Tax=uncultured organism TaxID=155900 RepID=D8VMQ5_9ZZZZ|nr:conserved hypothetical protein [uncultured organism]
MLFQIILRTPVWVWVLLALLLWQGFKLARPSSTGLLRATLMPVAMVCLSIYGTVSAFGSQPHVVLAWLASALAMVTLVLRQFSLPASTRYDAAAKRIHQPGSFVPLALMMGIFFTKYGVGVSIAMHPALAQDPVFSTAFSALYGGFSGIFAARALRLQRLVHGQNNPLVQPV